MIDLSLQAVEIRQFLLGQLPEARAERLEERIFAEPDFAEEVELAETELIEDYLAGKLAPEERKQFDRKYLTSTAGLEAVEYEAAFAEFIRTRLRGSEPVSGGEHAQAATAPSEAETHPPTAVPDEPQSESWAQWLKRLLTVGSASSRFKFAAFLLVALGVGIWSLLFWYLPRPTVDAPMSAERRALEADLARLNADAAASMITEARVTVDLMPMRRGGGSVPRLPSSDLNRGGHVKLRLRLAQTGPASYRAVFLDDQRNELFAVSNLTARNTPDGPQVWLLVPAKYFRPGDYQISLSAVNNEGGGEEINSYALRVVENR